MEKLKIAVLASGRGSNLQSIMDNIDNGKINGEIVLVLSNNPEAYALKRAAAGGIKTKFLLPGDYADRKEYDRALAEEVKKSGAELVLLAGFMRILSQEFLDHFPGQVINIHPSLLPSFPGLHAQKQAFDYGVKISGCTVHFVDAGLDSGPIIAQRSVPVLDDDTADTLADRILVEEHILYSQVVADIADGKVKINGRKTTRESQRG